MRILLLNNLYPPHLDGGAEIVAADFAVGLERLGHEVFVLTSSYGLPWAQQEGKTWRILDLVTTPHFDWHQSPWQQLRKPYDYYRGYYNANNARKLRHIVEEIKPGILYIWELPGIGVNSLLRTLPDLEVPIVFHMESYWLLYAQSPETTQSRIRMRWLKKWLIGTVPDLTMTSLIACSATVKQKYTQSGLDAERIEVIYNGIDSRFLDLPRNRNNDVEDRSGTEKKATKLLFAGRLSLEKGVLVILKALDILINEQGRENLHLDIFGGGDEAYVKELHDFLHTRNLAHVVTFHGKVTQDELIKYYDAADITLVPSLWEEPFGLVVAEAMAREVPVIASNVGGPAEIITQGVNGLLVEPGDAQQLALAITRLVERQEEGKQLSQAARATVLERFTIEANVRRVEQHLLKAVQGDKEVAHTQVPVLGNVEMRSAYIG